MTVFAAPSMPRTAQAADAFDSFAEVDSTNAELRRRCLDADPFARGLAAKARGEGESAGVPIGVVAAQRQSGGHGRLGRAWSDEAGESFVASFLTPLPRGLVFGPYAGWLTMAAGVAAVDALRGVLRDVGARPLRDGVQLAVKWPNDVFVTGPSGDGRPVGRKLGGILIESADLPACDTVGDRDHVALITGIGLNLGIAADRLPTAIATSLQLDFGPLPAFDELRDRIGAALTIGLRGRFAALAADPAGEAAALRDRLAADCWTIGRPVEVTRVDGTTITGVATSIAPDAALAVRDADGETHMVHTGDVGVLAA